MAITSDNELSTTGGYHNFVPQDDYHVRLCAICGRGKFDCLESNRRRRPMPPVITCPNCGLTYYQTAAPHVCAEWGKRKPMQHQKRITQSPLSSVCPNCGLSYHAANCQERDDPVTASAEREPPARAGDDRRDGSKRYLLSEIEHLLAERERLLKAAQFSLTTPGFIRGRDELQKAVDAALNEQGKDNNPNE